MKRVDPTTWRGLRVVFAVAVMLLLAQPAVADLIYSREETESGNRQVYKLTLTPAAEPIPAFKHRFSVPPHKTIPGNAVTHYLRSLGEGSLRSPTQAARKRFSAWEREWLGLELANKDLPLADLKTVCGFFDGYIDHHIRRLAMCRDNDWGLNEEHLRGREAVEFLLPSVQQTRQVSRVLLLTSRLAIRERRYSDAVDLLRMNYRMGQMVSEMKFLVSSLVGIACTGITNSGTLELMAAPGSPNLYWALSELPSPPISIRKSMQVDVSMGLRRFPILEQLLDDSKIEMNWKHELENVVRDVLTFDPMSYESKPLDSLKPELRASVTMAPSMAGIFVYPAAKKRLVALGYDKKSVEAMAVGKVILLDAANDYQRAVHETEKAFYVDNFKLTDAVEQEMRNGKRTLRLGLVLADMLMPATSQVKRAEKRVSRDINLLRTIESIREYAASKGGLPKKLSDLNLPAGIDSMTGKPFVYSLKGDTAIIEIEKIAGDTAKRYEITLAK